MGYFVYRDGRATTTPYHQLALNSWYQLTFGAQYVVWRHRLEMTNLTRLDTWQWWCRTAISVSTRSSTSCNTMLWDARWSGSRRRSQPSLWVDNHRTPTNTAVSNCSLSKPPDVCLSLTYYQCPSKYVSCWIIEERLNHTLVNPFSTRRLHVA